MTSSTSTRKHEDDCPYNWGGNCCCLPTSTPQDELDSPFIKEFRELKQLRNSHQIDEPEFDERVEQLAADTYAHPIREGWCCACDADIAFATSYIKDEPEFQALIDRTVAERELAMNNKVDRLEVIDGTGRAYVKGSIYGSPIKLELSYQDNGRTLKVFVSAAVQEGEK